MPCLLGCLALFFPRFVIILVVIFSDYIGKAFAETQWPFLIPFLGFLFMPLTTLAYAFAWHNGGGTVQGIGLVLVIVAVLSDFGLLGASERHRRQHWRGR
jgi:hypothetical protein